MRVRPRSAAGAAASQTWIDALTRVMARVTANADREGVLQALVAGIVDSFGAALARIWLYDPADAALSLSAGAGVTGDLLSGSDRIPTSDTGPLVMRAFLQRERVVVDRLSPDSWPHPFDLVEQHGLRAYAAFPLLIGDRAIGSMGVALRTALPPFMVEALSVLAQQAALALDHARVIEETQALQAVAASLASERNPDALLDRIVKQTATALKADACAVWLLDDGQSLAPAASYGMADDLYRKMLGLLSVPREVRGLTTFERLQETRTPIFTVDERRRAIEDHDSVGEAIANEGIVSAGRLPLFEPGGRVMGMLALYHRHERAYGESEVRLAQAFADQIAVAIHNARLYRAQEERLQETQALQRVTEALSSSLDLDRVLELTLSAAMSLFRADRAAIFMYPAGGPPSGMRCAASSGLSQEYIAATYADYREMVGGQAEALDELYVPDAQADPRNKRMRRAARREGVRSILSIAMRFAGEQIGTYALYHDSVHRYTPAELGLAHTFASQAAIAIEHSRLLLRSQDAAALEERARLARELHDSVSQALFGISLGASSLREVLDRNPAKAPGIVDYLVSLARTGLAEMRALIFELRPEAIGNDGLVRALDKQAEALRLRHGVVVDVQFCAEPQLSLEAKHALFRIAQEALHNAVKHARAGRFTLALTDGGGVLELTVGDDGVGFDPTASFDGHLGQRSMRERAEQIGGTLVVRSEPGAGTMVTARVPSAG